MKSMELSLSKYIYPYWKPKRYFHPNSHNSGDPPLRPKRNYHFFFFFKPPWLPSHFAPDKKALGERSIPLDHPDPELMNLFIYSSDPEKLITILEEIN